MRQVASPEHPSWGGLLPYGKCGSMTWLGSVCIYPYAGFDFHAPHTCGLVLMGSRTSTAQSNLLADTSQVRPQ